MTGKCTETVSSTIRQKEKNMLVTGTIYKIMTVNNYFFVTMQTMESMHRSQIQGEP